MKQMLGTGIIQFVEFQGQCHLLLIRTDLDACVLSNFFNNEMITVSLIYLCSMLPSYWIKLWTAVNGM